MGLLNEDPNKHISNFLEVCDTVKYNGVSDDEIHLRPFPFSLKDNAKHCLNLEPLDSITTWDDLVHKFLSKFFPLAKAEKKKRELRYIILLNLRERLSLRRGTNIKISLENVPTMDW